MDKYLELINKQKELIAKLDKKIEQKEAEHEEEASKLHSKKHCVRCLKEKIKSKKGKLASLRTLQGKNIFLHSAKTTFDFYITDFKKGLKEKRGAFLIGLSAAILGIITITTLLAYNIGPIAYIIVSGIIICPFYILPAILFYSINKKFQRENNIEDLEADISKLSQELENTKSLIAKHKFNINNILFDLGRLSKENDKAKAKLIELEASRQKVIESIATEELINQKFDSYQRLVNVLKRVKKEGGR